MHPLHTQEWIDKAVATGMPLYEITRRCTGQTTSNMLFALSHVIKHPGEVYQINDHYGTPAANSCALEMLHGMVEKLGLEHIHFNRADCSVVFENRDRFVEEKGPLCSATP